MTLVVGVDPGLSASNPCGLVLVDTDTMKLLYTDAFRPVGATWAERVQSIAGRVQWLITTVKPELIAYELPPYINDYQVTIKLSHVGGAVLAIAALYGVPVVGVSPSEGKQALSGNAKADKQAMINAVRNVFGVDVVKDIADAVGAGLAGEALVRRQALTGVVS